MNHSEIMLTLKLLTKNNMNSKRCTTCNEIKAITEFQFSRPNVRRSNCKSCQNEYNKNYRKLNLKPLTEKRKEYMEKYRTVNKGKRNTYLKEWGAKNPELKRAQKYRHRYKINIEDYHELYLKQKGLCAICKKKDLGRKNAKYFIVDHDHSANKVRGLLCHKCNLLLGTVKDDITILKRAIEYLT